MVQREFIGSLCVHFYWQRKRKPLTYKPVLCLGPEQEKSFEKKYILIVLKACDGHFQELTSELEIFQWYSEWQSSFWETMFLCLDCQPAIACIQGLFRICQSSIVFTRAVQNMLAQYSAYTGAVQNMLTSYSIYTRAVQNKRLDTVNSAPNRHRQHDPATDLTAAFNNKLQFCMCRYQHQMQTYIS